jgi:glutathione S-transferase
MKLYFDPLSTWARPITFLLHDQGVAFEEELVALHLGEQRTPEFLALNPNGQVPVLDDDGFVLTQSNAILKYLAVRLQLPVYPARLQDQARVDEMTTWFTTTFSLFHCAFGVFPRMLPELSHLAAATAADMESLGAYGSQRYLSVLEKQFEDGRRFACGDELSIADYAGVAQVTLAEFIAFDFTPYPRVAAWIERMKSRPGWDAAFAAFRGFVAAAHSPHPQPALRADRLHNQH